MRGWWLLFVASCAANDDSTSTSDDMACLSGQTWKLGLLGSPQMNPGRPCLDCHGPADRPTFTAAGTVFDAFDEPDDCFGAANVTVEVEDAAGKIVSTTTNNAGNFFFEDEPFELPVIARVIRDGSIRTMPRFVFSANCNDCHTSTGKLGAPGRILAPQE